MSKINKINIEMLEDFVESFMDETIPEGELSDKKMNLVYNYLEKFVEYVEFQILEDKLT